MSAVEGVARTGNGRSLAYPQMGQRDGSPLFYFHGDPGSRLEFDHPLNRPALDGTGVRLIGIDRPGFGGSTREKQRAYGDWPSDVLAVADHLGLDRFGILAYSAGGPYAVACALAFPDRLSFVGIVSGVGPFETPRGRDGMQRTVVIATRLAGRAPTVLRWVVKRTSPERFSRQFGKELSSVDRALYRQAGAPEAVRDAFAEATRNGPDGLVDDWRLMAVPSGLDYTAVKCAVHLWHGIADGIIPHHHAQYVAKLIPMAELELLPGVGHLHTADRWRGFIDTARVGDA